MDLWNPSGRTHSDWCPAALTWDLSRPHPFFEGQLDLLATEKARLDLSNSRVANNIPIGVHAGYASRDRPWSLVTKHWSDLTR